MWYHIGGIFKKGTNELMYKTEIESWVQKTNYGYQEMGWGDKLRDWDWNILTQFNSVQSLSRVWLSATPWVTALQASLSITNSWSLLKLSPSSGDAIQQSHPLLSPSPPAPNPSQHQGLFQWVNSLQEVAKVLEFQLQHQSFQWTPRTICIAQGCCC